MSVYQRMCQLAAATGTTVTHPRPMASCFNFQLPNGQLIMSLPDRDGHTTEVSFMLGAGIDRPLEERLCNGLCAGTRARFHDRFQEFVLLVGALEQALDYYTGLKAECEVLPDGTQKYTVTKVHFPAGAQEATITVVAQFTDDGWYIS